MLVMVVFFIAFRWIHLSTPLIRLFLLVLILLLMPTLNFLPVWFALSLLRFRLPSRLPMMFILWMVAMMVVIIPSRTVCLFSSFFFQAEDGIRDRNVTGVQTCALPISRIIPMTDDPVRTFVHTEAGRHAFQDYLVRRGARGRVRRIEVAGARRARPAPGVLPALAAADVIVVAPSNPLVSIGPILAIAPIRRALARRQAPAAAISPLVGGRAVRGPLHRMLRGLGLEVSPAGVARLYRGLVDVFVLDRVDAAWAPRVEA